MGSQTLKQVKSPAALLPGQLCVSLLLQTGTNGLRTLVLDVAKTELEVPQETDPWLVAAQQKPAPLQAQRRRKSRRWRWVDQTQPVTVAKDAISIPQSGCCLF